MHKMFRKVYRDSLLKNSIFLLMTNFSSSIFGFFFWVIAARHYTPNDIGIVSAILSSIFIITMISLIGLPTALTFYLPRYSKNANRIINSCLMINIIISILFSLVFIFKVDILAPELKTILEDFALIIIFIIIVIMTTISSLMFGIFTAGKRSSFHMIKENIFGFIKILPLILFPSFGVMGILMSWTTGLIISVIVGFFLLFKLWRYTPTFTFDPIIKNMASFSIGNYIAGIFYNLPKFIFPIMIIQLISAESAGYFFIAMTIAGLLYGISESIAGPFLAEASDKEKFWHNVYKAIKFNIGLLIPGLLSFMLFGKFVLNVFDPNYAEHSFTTLIILSMASIPLSLVGIFNIIINAQKRVMTMVKINIVVATTTIILSIPFIKMWNIEGAAIAYLIANTVMAAIIIFKMKNPIGFISNMLNGDKDVISI